MTIQILR